MHRLFTQKRGSEESITAYCDRCEVVVEPVPVTRGDLTTFMCPNSIGKSHRGRGITLHGKPYIAGTRLHWTAEVKRLAAHKCELIGIEGHECSGDLTAHHMIRVAKRPRLELEISNGVCLCAGPHGRLHEDPDFEKLIWRWFMLHRTVDADYILRFDKFADVAVERTASEDGTIVLPIEKPQSDDARVA